ncbi:MAG: NAD(P)-dependent oxidoreductase [Ignavibacteriaceae bacterium]|nr:NAD(P)-dependent oxidoreductase [Ignavibacteriaceae bacterium]
MLKILLCGNKSFVATGLQQKLVEAGFLVDSFSRGNEERNGTQVTGDVFKVSSNIYLADDYDVVINFIVLKDLSMAANLHYINELIDLCRIKSVKNLIHISSIIVYKNKEPFVDENTIIEEHTNKAGYGAIKIGVDQYLLSLKNINFKISFIRLGYVLTEGQQLPFISKLPFRFALIKGAKNSVLPIVKRKVIHQAIVNMLKLKNLETVYLFVPDGNKTKYEYVKETVLNHYFFLPKWFILGAANLFTKIRLLPKSFYTRLEGMFIETQYNSSKTQKLLDIKF